MRNYLLIAVAAAALLLSGCGSKDLAEGNQKCINWSPLTGAGAIVMAMRGVKRCGDDTPNAYNFDNLSNNSQ